MFGAFFFGGGFFGAFTPTAVPSVNEPAQLVVEAETMGFNQGWVAVYQDLADTVVSIKRAFQSDAPDDLVQAPATASFAMVNGANTFSGLVGRYSTDNANCLPGWAKGIRLRIRLRAGITLRTRFFGVIQSIKPTMGLYHDRVAAVTAASWLAMASTTLATGIQPQTNQRGDQLLTTLTALTQFAPPATSFAAGADTYAYALDDLDPNQNSLMDGIDSITKSGLDRAFEYADGTLVFEAYATRRSNPASIFTITDVPPGTFPGFAVVEGGTVEDSLTAVYNKVQLTGHPRSVDAAAVVLYGYPVSASNPSIASGATAVIKAPYVDPNQKAQAVGGFNMLISDGGAGAVIGTSGSLPTADFQFTSLPSGGGTDVSASMVVTVVYELRQATFTVVNNSGATAYYNKLQCRGQGIYDYVQAVGTSTNNTSIGKFAGQTLKINCPYQTSQDFLNTKAAYITEVYGIGVSKFDQGLPFFVAGNDFATLDKILAREISDPISVTETVSGITAGPYWINGIEEHYDARCNLTGKWLLARRFSAPITQSFSSAQTSTPFVVPSNVTSIVFEGWGGAGGPDGSGAHPGGGSGYILATVPVTPGETLFIDVGGPGAKSARVYQGAGGGGYTALRRGSTVLALASGGGGASFDAAGAPGGGTTGSSGLGTNPPTGGTQLAGGSAGTNSDGADVAATAGSSEQGGPAGGWAEGSD